MSLKVIFLRQYCICFDTKGAVTNCGREACKKLIIMAQKLAQNTVTQYGDATTGILNEENIKELYKRIKSELPPSV